MAKKQKPLLKNLKRNKLKDIEARWYLILKKSGFNDIEDTKHPLRPLKTWHGLKWSRVSPELCNAKREYFENAARFLWIYEFESLMEKDVWGLHSEGFSIREIETKLSISRNQVHKIVVYLREIMQDWGDD